METSSHDVLLVGGGGAGFARRHRRCRNQPQAQRRGGLQGLSDAQPYGLRRGRRRRRHRPTTTRLDEHAYDTISGGDWLGDQDAVEVFVNEAPKELLRLEHWGCPWSRRAGRQDRGASVRRHEKDAHVVCRRQDRLPHAAHALPDLAQIHRVTRYDETFATKLLVDDGRGAGRGRDRADDRQGPRDHAPRR